MFLLQLLVVGVDVVVACCSLLLLVVVSLFVGY